MKIVFYLPFCCHVRKNYPSITWPQGIVMWNKPSESQHAIASIDLIMYNRAMVYKSSALDIIGESSLYLHFATLLKVNWWHNQHATFLPENTAIIFYEWRYTRKLLATALILTALFLPIRYFLKIVSHRCK